MREFMTVLNEGGIMDMMLLTHLFNGIRGGEPLADVVSVRLVGPRLMEITMRGREDGKEFAMQFEIASFKRV